MGESSDPYVEQLSPEDAFALVADETRFRILTALQDADDPVRFSDLRETVGVEDSGRFNYHLDQLRGQFIRQTDDGYTTAEPGERLVGAVLSGGYTVALEGETVRVDGTCFDCGGHLEARFAEQRITIDCPECEAMFTNPQIPAGLVAGHDPTEAPGIVARWMHVTTAAMDAEICLNCDGHLDRTLHVRGDPAAPDWLTDEEFLGMLVLECERCGHRYNTLVQIAILTHPVVAAYHYEYDLDLRETPLWRIPWIEAGRGTIESRDPLRLSLPIPLGDETRTFVFDGALELVEERAG